MTWPGGGSRATAWISPRTAWAPASTWKRSCCTCKGGSGVASRKRSNMGRRTPGSSRTRCATSSGWREVARSCRVPCARGLTRTVRSHPTIRRKSCGSIYRLAKLPPSTSPNWLRRSWKHADARRSVFPCGASTSKRCSAANGLPARRSPLCSPTSVKGCCTSPSPNALCSPMRWGGQDDPGHRRLRAPAPAG